MKKVIKHYLKNSQLLCNIIARIILIYLKFSYFTSKWHIVMPEGFDKSKIDQEDGLCFALWHNRLAYSIYIFGEYKNVFGLVSPHSDGKILSQTIIAANHKIIEGSSNKNSTKAVKQIIKQLTAGKSKIVITPDGPRGPIYKNGSVITKIASKYNKKIFPVSCCASRYFELNSWDKMMIPKPFSTIWVTFGSPLILSGNDAADRLLLENTLSSLK